MPWLFDVLGEMIVLSGHYVRSGSEAIFLRNFRFAKIKRLVSLKDSKELRYIGPITLAGFSIITL